ncbi:MAG: Uma2 family endonuclease [Deltaproteobacteria bacterium]|nr:Uma2 family endonuclease [Deltaproteobacteria bacterium]
MPDQASWAKGVPLLAVEYADRGQNLEELQTKIDELLSAGTKWIWVVRLSGPRRVEVHEPGVPKRVALPGQLLVAPGVLQNPVRVEELYDESAAHEAQLRNLLQRKGYASLRAALDSSEQAGLEKGEKLGIEKGEKLGLEKGEKLGIEKGEKLGIEKGEKLGIEKGEKLGIEKGEKLGIEKGEKLGIEKGEKLGIEKGLRLAVESVCVVLGVELDQTRRTTLEGRLTNCGRSSSSCGTSAAGEGSLAVRRWGPSCATARANHRGHTAETQRTQRIFGEKSFAPSVLLCALRSSCGVQLNRRRSCPLTTGDRILSSRRTTS